MIKMNEKYAANLEHIVAERTSLLVEAQEQTDRLLCEMLPPFVVLFAKAYYISFFLILLKRKKVFQNFRLNFITKI